MLHVPPPAPDAVERLYGPVVKHIQESALWRILRLCNIENMKENALVPDFIFSRGLYSLCVPQSPAGFTLMFITLVFEKFSVVRAQI